VGLLLFAFIGSRDSGLFFSVDKKKEDTLTAGSQIGVKTV